MEAAEFAEIMGRFLEASDEPLFCYFDGAFRTHLVSNWRLGATNCGLPLEGDYALYQAGREEDANLPVPPLEDTLCGTCLKEYQDV